MYETLSACKTEVNRYAQGWTRAKDAISSPTRQKVLPAHKTSVFQCARISAQMASGCCVIFDPSSAPATARLPFEGSPQRRAAAARARVCPCHVKMGRRALVRSHSTQPTPPAALICRRKIALARLSNRPHPPSCLPVPCAQGSTRASEQLAVGAARTARIYRTEQKWHFAIVCSFDFKLCKNVLQNTFVHFKAKSQRNNLK